VAGGRWGALACCVAVVYAGLPAGPRVGLAVARTAPGAWLLGPGLPALTAAGALGLAVALWRRGAPPRAWAALAGAAAGYALGFSWLHGNHLERTHLAVYGVVAWLAWRAVAPLAARPAARALAAAGMAAAIGWGDELLQSVVPGRVYDLRDVATNGLGAVLGVAVVAAVHAGRRPGSAPDGEHEDHRQEQDHRRDEEAREGAEARDVGVDGGDVLPQ
jgi:hypothetical protein